MHYLNTICYRFWTLCTRNLQILPFLAGDRLHLRGSQGNSLRANRLPSEREQEASSALCELRIDPFARARTSSPLYRKSNFPLARVLIFHPKFHHSFRQSDMNSRSFLVHLQRVQNYAKAARAVIHMWIKWLIDWAFLPFSSLISLYTLFFFAFSKCF